MTQDDRKAWLSAAHRALAKYPDHIIERAADEALRRADHPSKIVPIMTEEAERIFVRDRPKTERPIALPAPVETAEQAAERLEVAELMRGLVAKLSMNS